METVGDDMTQEMHQFLTACDLAGARFGGQDQDDLIEIVRFCGMRLAAAAREQAKREMMQ